MPGTTPTCALGGGDMKKILIAMLLLAAFVAAGTSDLNDEHGPCCGCDTCCSLGLVPVVNPSGVDYANGE